MACLAILELLQIRLLGSSMTQIWPKVSTALQTSLTMIKISSKTLLYRRICAGNSLMIGVSSHIMKIVA